MLVSLSCICDLICLIFAAFIALHMCPTFYLYNNNKFMLFLLLFLYCRVLCKVFNSRRCWALAKVIAKALKRFHVNFFASLFSFSFYLRSGKHYGNITMAATAATTTTTTTTTTAAAGATTAWALLQQQLQLQSNAAGQ